MSNITVLTPTYNRASMLEKLYWSLCNQDCKEFEWVIVDDGSTDHTSNLIERMKKEADFPIYYHRKENGGKHTALNYSYQFIHTPLIFIVDSDDVLTSDAISCIEDVYEQFHDEKDLCGFSFLRANTDGEYLSSSGIPFDGMKESFIECRINRRIRGDMIEVWYTHCLKEFPFPEFVGEKFLGEDIVWIKMAEKYKMRFFNRVINITEYLNEGLTNNRRKLNIMSPNGCIARAEAFLASEANLCAKMKAALQYQVYGRIAGKTSKELFLRSCRKDLFAVMYLPAKMILWIWGYQKYE